MTKCKYKNENWNFKCPYEADEGSEHCYWHQNIEQKTPTKERIEELKSSKIIGAYLKKIDLSKSVLEDMKLEHGLNGISLIESNLEGADFSQTALIDVNFTNSKIRGAYFDHAILKKVYFNLVELKETCFDNADLTEVDFSNADLRSTSFLKASVKNSFFINSNMQGANFSDSEIKSSNLKNAKMQNAILIDANMQGVNLRDTQMQGSILENTFFDSKSNFKNTNLINANLYNTYIDESGTFKDAVLFESKKIDEKEINEHIGDAFNVRKFSIKKNLILEFEITAKILKFKGDMQVLEYIQKNELIKYLSVENIPIKVIFYNELISFILKKEIDYSKVEEVSEKILSSRKNPKVKIIFLEEIKKAISNDVFESIYNDLQKLDLIKSRTFANDSISNISLEDLGNSIDLTNLLSNIGPREYILSYDLINYTQSEKELSTDVKRAINKAIFPKKIFYNQLFKRVPVLEKLQFMNISNKYLLISVNDECVLHYNSLEFYNSAHEVYNRLYNFYSTHGDTLNSKHTHYRRAESYRKFLLVKGGFKNIIRAGIFDGFILKILAGHGDRIWNPIVCSASGICLFALSFFILDGITVNDRKIKIIDYLYFSLTNFAGYSFPNVQPNITIPLVQPLVMAESIFGLMMVSLIIFVITYQISR